jgi:hypothetical protein
MSTTIGQRVDTEFPTGQIFVEGPALSVSAAIDGITMAVSDFNREVNGAAGFDPLFARQSCSALVRVSREDGQPVEGLTPKSFRIAMFRSVGDWADVPVSGAARTDASIHAPSDFVGQLAGVYLVSFVATDDMFDDGGFAYKGNPNYLHQRVLLISVTSYAAGKPIVVSKGRAFATMPFFYTAFPNGEG